MTVVQDVGFIEEIKDGLKAPGRNLAEHPLIEKINRRELTRGQLKGLMIQITLQTRDIVRWIAAMYADCPYPEVRRKIFMSLYEEELGGFSNSKAHFELCADCARALGATDEELATARPLAATQRMILFGEVYQRNRGWIAAFGSAMGFEYQSPLAFKRIGAGLREHYGLDDAGVRFFDVHVTADEDHSAAIVEMLIEHATTPETQRVVRDTAWACAEAYYDMMNVYQAFQ
jgi:pyrroloquinoline quinone (PQQ) biosynthesis protein C